MRSDGGDSRRRGGEEGVSREGSMVEEQCEVTSDSGIPGNEGKRPRGQDRRGGQTSGRGWSQEVGESEMAGEHLLKVRLLQGGAICVKLLTLGEAEGADAVTKGDTKGRTRGVAKDRKQLILQAGQMKEGGGEEDRVKPAGTKPPRNGEKVTCPLYLLIEDIQTEIRGQRRASSKDIMQMLGIRGAAERYRTMGGNVGERFGGTPHFPSPVDAKLRDIHEHDGMLRESNQGGRLDLIRMGRIQTARARDEQ